MLSAEDLLAGSQLTFVVAVPRALLRPSANGHSGDAAPDEATGDLTVRLRPLTVGDMQMIARAAKEKDNLVATLMVQQALVEPKLSVAQVAAMHAGLVQFLLDQVNHISGINLPAQELDQAVEAPLARAAFLLAQAFGWTPQEISGLTLGQVLLHLQMLHEQTRA
jgi:hypothetical protein